MSTVLPLPTTTQPAPHTAGRGPLAGFGKRHVFLVLLFAVLTPLTFALCAAALGEKMKLDGLLVEIGVFLAIGTAALFSAIVADNLLRHRLGQAWRVAGAIVAAAVLGALLTDFVIGHAVASLLGWDREAKLLAKGISTTTHRLAVEFLTAAHWSLVLVVLYELLESGRRAMGELHTARMSALAAQQSLVEGELHAMQARLDPDLLFDSLAAIDDGYARGVECGQQRLDEMIRFLRAALPSDSAGTSTVAREREIVEAYVALHAQRTPDAADLSVEIDAGAHFEQMPSMLLLPLVRSALAARSARHLRVRIRRATTTLVVEIESDASSDDAAPLDEIASVRQRLNRLYPEGAQLSVSGGARPWQMLLEIPKPQAAAA